MINNINKKAQLDEISPFGILGGLIGGAIGVVIAKRMGAGMLIVLLAFIICAIATYFIAWKVTDA